MLRNEDVYGSLDQKPYESFYLYVEATIEHSVERVWPHALNIGGWMSAHRLETVSGAQGHVGHFERVYPRGLGNEVPLPHYHLYGIAHIVPKKMIVLEVFPEKGGSYGNTRQKMSFDTIFLTDLATKTLVGFHMTDVHLGKGNEETRARRLRELSGVGEMLNKYFDNLRQLIESGG